MKTTILCASLLCASVCVGQTVGLKDTLRWMHNFVTDNGHQYGSQSLVDNQSCSAPDPNCQPRHDSSTFDSQGCAATITWSVTLGYKDNGMYSYRVSLKDLDPSSVTWVKDPPFENAVHADTTDSVKAVAQTFTPPKGSDVNIGPSQLTWVELVFDSRSDAERFTKAFKHAIELCGGKRSVF